jgi:hypothetical protein
MVTDGCAALLLVLAAALIFPVAVSFLLTPVRKLSKILNYAQNVQQRAAAGRPLVVVAGFKNISFSDVSFPFASESPPPSESTAAPPEGTQTRRSRSRRVRGGSSRRLWRPL